MTRKECIEKIKKVNFGNYPITIYNDLCNILQEYNEDLYEELTDLYVDEATIVANIKNMDNLDTIRSAVECIENGSGVYYEWDYQEYEDADLEQLKRDILDTLENCEEDKE